MGDIGIKVTLPGHDVQRAPDSQQLFNSSWPTVKLYKNLFTPANPGASLKSAGVFRVFHHGLGFVPAVVAYGGVAGSGQPNAGYQTVADINRQNIAVDNQDILFLTPGGPAGTVSIGLLILYLDIEKNYTAPNINPGSSADIGVSKDYGIKATKENADINSHDLRDFVIHSSTRSPLIHAVAAGPVNQPSGTTYSFSYTHNLPYSPLFFAYVQDVSGNYVLTNGYAGVSAVGNTITVYASQINGQFRNASIVVLKDPFNISDNVVNVNI